MNFLYPLGFLGLIAIPVLIIIYIIKSKYTEQVVTSTYLWTLSERFLKHKNPIHRITGIISLILQILAVIFISVAIAQPVFTLADAANDFCFVLDASGSMNIVRDGETRLEQGKKEISSIIGKSVKGSTYTLIYAGNTADIVYENIEDKDTALTLLNDLTPSYTDSNVTFALSAVQKYFTENPSLQVYFVTDKVYESYENAEVINVSGGETNYAVSDVAYALSGGKLQISGKAVSYESAAELNISLYVDGAEEPQSTQTLSVEKLEPVEFTFGSDSLDFKSLKVKIENTDALALDNESIIYNVRYDESFTTLIVSDTPFFMQAVLSSLGNAQIDVVSTADYKGAAGYGLYIFDTYSPAALPKDGAVWFVNPVSSVADTGFSVQGGGEAGRLRRSTSTKSTVRRLLQGLTGESADTDIYVTDYVKCGQYKSFTNVLTCAGNPVLFAGTNAYGNREVVFAFDLHNSDFALSLDFPVLANNLLSYTFPEIVEDSSFFCGDSVEINVLANCDSIRVDTPLGKVEYTDTNGASVEYPLEEVGVYTVTAVVNGVPRTVSLYSALPLEERETSVVSEQSFTVGGEASSERRDGRYDDLIAFFIVLAVLIIADWMVYCYEQYQLR